MSEKLLDNVVNQAGKQTMIGVVTMIVGGVLTPVCPVVGPIIFDFGLGFSSGSTGFAIGAEIGDKISKM